MKRFSRVKLSFVWICLLPGLIWLVSACGGPPAAVSVVTPAIGEPKVGAPSPQQPGEEIGISIEIASTGGATLSYTWAADGGEIVRGQGSPAITYRVPPEPGTYNIRVKVEWDGQSVEKVTSVKVEGAAAAATPEPPDDTPEPPADTPKPNPTDTPKPANTPKPPTATPINTPKPSITPISSLLKNAQVIYTADLTKPTHWPERPDVVVLDGKLAFTPQEFEEVWANDFSQELDDFVVSATFSYDTQDRDDIGVAIVVGEPFTGNFFFLGANPNNRNTLWYFVMVKNWEHIHPDISPPMTPGQPDQFSVQIVRRGTQVSAYVNGEEIMTREDIVFESRAEQMQIGVHADGDGSTIFLHKLSVTLPVDDLSHPTPTPTATIDADPMVYDNFNNPGNDGSFDKSRWGNWTEPPYQITQQSGVLAISHNGKAEKGSALVSRKFINFASAKPIFFETRLMLDSNGQGKSHNVQMNLSVNFGDDKGWSSECGIDDGNAYCFDTLWPNQDGHWYDATGKLVGYESWHTFRIELEPATMTFTYYIDGQKAGSHIPVDAARLKKSKFTFNVGIWSSSTEIYTGYIDDVRIGPIGQ